MSDRDFTRSSIGLGIDILLNPIDIIYAYSAFYNGGILFNNNQKVLKRININTDVIAILHQGMKECYLIGTAKPVYEKTQIADIICKTGTGVSVTNGKADWRKNIGWVVLFSPSVNPTFGMMVIVDKSRSYSACNIAAKLIKFILDNKLL